MRKFISKLLVVAALALPSLSLAESHDEAANAYDNVPWQHAIHMFGGEPLYPADFPHWNYVNPDAPRTGTLTLGSFGSFTTLTYGLNSNGDEAPGVKSLYNTLLTSSADEIDTSYGELAELIKLPPSRNWVAFKLHSEAKWTDGSAVTPRDVIFTWEKSRAEGGPTFKTAFEMVTNIEDKGDNVVLFTLNPEEDNREAYLAIGGQEIIPEYYWADKDMTETTLVSPAGSGPYVISDLKAGQFIEYKLRPDYWAMDLPFNRGLNNYETIRYQMYKETEVMRLAVISGDIDYRAENQAKAWAKNYEGIEAIEAGVLKKEWFDDPSIMNMTAAFYNTKLEKFQDRRVRQALGLAFNFEWTNKTMFFGQYDRIHSHFQNSFLEATGLPEGYELEVLEKFRGQVPDTVFDEPHRYPETDGTLNNRDQLRQALGLFTDAGYSLDSNRQLVKDGEQLSVDLVIRSPEFERLVLPWMDNLKKIGVDANVRLLDPTQYWEKLLSKDFEMMITGLPHGYTPGLDTYYKWHSKFAEQKASWAIHGVKSDVLDEMLEMMLKEADRERLNALGRAFDRIIRSEHYVTMTWGLSADRILYWDKFGIPENKPNFGTGVLSTWWIDPAKEATLEERRADMKVPDTLPE